MLQKIISNIFSVKIILLAGFVAITILALLMSIDIPAAKTFYSNLDDSNFLENVSLWLSVCTAISVISSVLGFCTLCQEKANKPVCIIIRSCIAIRR